MSKQLYMHKGNMFTVTNSDSTEIHKQLPPGVYVIGCALIIGYYFESVQDFQLPPKFYGELPKVSERIINTYVNRLKEQGKPTGVLLKGEKGGGKTLLAKKVSADLKLPVILVNQPFENDDFKNIIANLGPAIVIFDEFEKVYNRKDEQNSILTLLDGVYPSECLFFVIVNDEYALTDALLNRPGRLFYSIEYKGLSNKFITDYCNDKLLNKNHTTSVLTVAAFFINFNFDMLQGLVEEMNRYHEPANEAVKYLNIKAEMFRSYEIYDVAVTYNGKPCAVRKGQEKLKGHPFSRSHMEYVIRPTDAQLRTYLKDVDTYFTITTDMVSKIDQENETYTYQNGLYEVTFTRNGDSAWSMKTGRRVQEEEE